MKKILIINLLFLIAFMQHNAYAQYAQKDLPVDSIEQIYFQNNISSYSGPGQHLVDAGKALMFTGASLALTGLACYIAGVATYESDIDCPEMPVYPMFAIVGAAAGGAIALVGLPFYICGNKKMKIYSANHIVFGNETQKGGTGFFEMGLGIPNFLSLDALGGYNFNKNIFVGAGLGYKTYLTAGLVQDRVMASFPIYANAKFSFGKKRIVPYIGANVGYDVANKGLYTGVEFGTRLRNAEGKRGASWWFGAKSEFASSDYMFFSLKVGRSF